MKRYGIGLVAVCWYLLTPALLSAQTRINATDWPYLDPKADSVAGISLNKAYDLLKGRPSVPVTVGVLDSGVDLEHPDLRSVLWTNPNEQPGNGTDDDKNGYVDDVHGWNFLGAPDGTTYEYDQPEITQTYLLLRGKYDNANRASLSPTEQRQYDTYQQAKKLFLPRYKAALPQLLAFTDTARFWQTANQLATLLPDSVTSQAAIRSANIGTDSVAVAVRQTLARAYQPPYGSFANYLNLVRQHFDRFMLIAGGEALIAYNPAYNARQSVGDNPADLTERYYGNPAVVIGKSAELGLHGSHVAGIIGATRGNGIGIDGVADNVRIMSVAVVPANGDERDKDIANGIRYAVDNGAKVLNMSFGKRLSPFKEQVDAAIRYALDHDVIIVHAAGNNGEDLDKTTNYPSATDEQGRRAPNVLTVGNSTRYLNNRLAASSSNYSLNQVDLFAPGTDINSTVPHNQYAVFSGTSMSAPHVAGVAALIRSYFPQLTAVQVCNILRESTHRPTLVVNRPGRSGDLTPFSTLSQTGGLLNAAAAVQLAIDRTRQP
ncbi:S8 family peptidase [Spirosoma rhododendri]|uniref:S8 family serine peptidase n=1 Tax=Spirosoma rhododendri TaxID=2728024 RepID=A0A7L5DN76_9BACT|nr:S8 family peptidase [Spirosoma rhododendri]QJD78931.1 S8 family serine peptidase [Spirosoma rhododendri]